MGAENRFNLGFSQKCKPPSAFWFYARQSFLLEVLQLCNSTDFRGILIYSKCKRGSKVIRSDMWESQRGFSSGTDVIPLEISQGFLTWPPCSPCLLNATLPFLVWQWDTQHFLGHPGEQSYHWQASEGQKGEAWSLGKATKCLCFNDRGCQTLYSYASELIY